MEEQVDHTSEGLRNSLLRSLDRLGLPQVDLLFLHEPEYTPRSERPRVLEVMCRLREEGLARRLGLAGGFKEGWEGFLKSGAIDVVMLFRRLDPCIFIGLEVDLPVIRQARALTYGASPLHMGLLGSRHEELVHGRPSRVWAAQVDRAMRLKAIAAAHGLPLATLAHRFMFGVGEIDRVVIGARTRAELRAALADFAAGPLPPEVFDEVCEGAPMTGQ
jgi:aryl-alcohol dehydrogenase-like predicted oxidoreductase